MTEELADPPNPDCSVIVQCFFSGGGHPDVDFALVVRIDPAVNEWPVPRFQGANHPRHLCRQNPQLALNVADYHRPVILEERQREIFDFFELSGPPQSAKRSEA